MTDKRLFHNQIKNASIYRLKGNLGETLVQ